MKIPCVGEETGYKLLKMGVETVKVLSEIPIEYLQNLMGKSGTDLWRKANGIDESPVGPYREQKSISTENTFQQDTIDLNFLNTELTRMAESIAYELHSQNKLTDCVTVKIRYTDFQTYTKQRSIPYINADGILLKEVMSLFSQLYERRQLIRLLGARFTHLIPGTHQVDMFQDTAEDIALYQAIDSIKNRFAEMLLINAGGI